MTEEIRAALDEIRRERYKAVFVQASLDAVCILLATDFVLGIGTTPYLDGDIAPATFRSLGVVPDIHTVIAVLGGIIAFFVEFVIHVRRPAAEQFEAVNPTVREALRTARDATEMDRTNPVAQALYDDVLDRLRETSSVGLVNGTRLAATVVFALVLSLATVQASVVDLGFGAPGPEANGGTGAVAAQTDAINDTSANLRDGDEVLGNPTDVSSGSENLSATVGSSPSGGGERDWNYDRDASGSESGTVETQRAGFVSHERIEDAALVRRYARKLRENETDV